MIERNFDAIFQDIYEEQFIDVIFPAFRGTVTRKAFMKAVNQPSMFGNVVLNPLDGSDDEA